MLVTRAPATGFGEKGSTSNAPQRTASRGHAVDLKWKASVSRVVGYYVYRSEMPQRPFTKLNSAPVRATRYSDNSVQPGHTYFYKVTSVDSKGQESVFSNQIKAIVPSP
jgi:fibronectin type 3 domain-containing protein